MAIRIETIIEQVEALDDDFMFFSRRKSPPTAKEIQAAEKAMGVKLSAEHRALVQALGCLAVTAKEQAWPRAKELEVRPRWQFLYGIEVFGVVPEGQAPALDVTAQMREREAESKKKLVPAMRWIGDRSCVGYAADGVLMEWAPGEAPQKLSGKSLLSRISVMLRDLAAAKDKMKAETAKGAKKRASKETDGVDPLVRRLLGKEDINDHIAAMRELEKVKGARRKSITDALLDALSGKKPNANVIGALSVVSEDARVFPALAKLAGHKDEEVREEVVSTLGYLESKPAGAVPVLCAALQDHNEDIRSAAAEALKEYAHPDAIDPLFAALRRVKKPPDGCSAWRRGTSWRRWVHAVRTTRAS